MTLSQQMGQDLIAHSRFQSKEMQTECETMFFFRVDYVPKMIKS